MTRWVFADGTTVELGGNVSGSSELASRLREDVARIEAGYEVTIWGDAPPGGMTSLDLSDSDLVDIWVRSRAKGVQLVEAPDLESEPEDPSSMPPGTVF